jgi:hypothetical protein
VAKIARFIRWPILVIGVQIFMYQNETFDRILMTDQPSFDCLTAVTSLDSCITFFEDETLNVDDQRFALRYIAVGNRIEK